MYHDFFTLAVCSTAATFPLKLLANEVFDREREREMTGLQSFIVFVGVLAFGCTLGVLVASLLGAGGRANAEDSGRLEFLVHEHVSLVGSGEWFFTYASNGRQLSADRDARAAIDKAAAKLVAESVALTEPMSPQTTSGNGG